MVVITRADLDVRVTCRSVIFRGPEDTWKERKMLEKGSSGNGKPSFPPNWRTQDKELLKLCYFALSPLYHKLQGLNTSLRKNSPKLTPILNFPPPSASHGCCMYWPMIKPHGSTAACMYWPMVKPHGSMWLWFSGFIISLLGSLCVSQRGQGWCVFVQISANLPLLKP